MHWPSYPKVGQLVNIGQGNSHRAMTKDKSIQGIGLEIGCGNQEWIISLHLGQWKCQTLIQIIHLPISALFLGYPAKPISPPLGHFRPISKGGFDIPGGRVHYRLFEGNLVGFLMDEIKWVRITHRSKKIDIGSNSWWNQDFIHHFLQIGWNKFESKENTR